MIDIPEVGKERDKIIANMKGLKWNTTIILSDHFTDYPHNPSWSTSRNEAWELWDEMKAATPILNYQIFDSNHVVNNAHSIDNQTMTISEEGNSFADVVSKAWIRWKEG